MSIAHCAISSVTNGLIFDPGSTGQISACSILSGMGPAGGVEGLRLPFSIGTPDSIAPEPNRVDGFVYGVRVMESGVHTDHVVVSNCMYGIHCDPIDVTASYCTLVGNTWGIYGGAALAVYNSIIVGPGEGGFYAAAEHQVNYDDAWGYMGAEWQSTLMGSQNSTYNPFFVSGDATYHLNPASFFTSFSVSGGQIGAYGPGAALPTPVATASVVEAGGSNGFAHVRWFSESAGGSRARILRKTEESDWHPLTVLYPDGLGYISLDDKDVTPGVRYGYAIGVQRGTTIGVDGEVWVTVEAPISKLAIQNVGPNPATTSWSIGFDSPATSEASIEAIDLSGRVVRTVRLGALTSGRQSFSLPAQGLPPGVYWIRVREGGSSTLSKAVKTN
jgi:hypothetical protein